jgi:hypothetical protein
MIRCVLMFGYRVWTVWLHRWPVDGIGDYVIWVDPSLTARTYKPPHISA